MTPQNKPESGGVFAGFRTRRDQAVVTFYHFAYWLHFREMQPGDIYTAACARQHQNSPLHRCNPRVRPDTRPNDSIKIKCLDSWAKCSKWHFNESIWVNGLRTTVLNRMCKTSFMHKKQQVLQSMPEMHIGYGIHLIIEVKFEVSSAAVTYRKAVRLNVEISYRLLPGRLRKWLPTN